LIVGVAICAGFWLYLKEMQFLMSLWQEIVWEQALTEVRILLSHKKMGGRDTIFLNDYISKTWLSGLSERWS
jgi:hypothetical protein